MAQGRTCAVLSSHGMRIRASAIAALGLLLLTACGGSKGKCDERVQVGNFSICLQKDWQQVPDQLLKEEGVPAETIAAFQLSEKRGGQRDNIVVSHENLPAKISAMKYSQANIQTIEVTPEYAQLEKREIKIDGQDTLLHIFTARPVPDLPARRFYQVSIVDGITGYVITGTLPFSVEDEIEKGLIEMVISGSLEE